MSALEARRIFNSGFDKTASAEKHYTSQQAESSVSQKSTFMTNRTSARRRHIIPLTFSTSLSQHISTRCPRSDDEIPVCPAINRRGNPTRERAKEGEAAFQKAFVFICQRWLLLSSRVWTLKQQVGSALRSQSAKVSRFRGKLDT